LFVIVYYIKCFWINSKIICKSLHIQMEWLSRLTKYHCHNLLFNFSLNWLKNTNKLYSKTTKVFITPINKPNKDTKRNSTDMNMNNNIMTQIIQVILWEVLALMTQVPNYIVFNKWLESKRNSNNIFALTIFLLGTTTGYTFSLIYRSMCIQPWKLLQWIIIFIMTRCSVQCNILRFTLENALSAVYIVWKQLVLKYLLMGW